MKIVLAYSGGLDTPVLMSWIKDKYNAEMTGFCADIGQEEDFKGLEQSHQNRRIQRFALMILRENSRDWKHLRYPGWRDLRRRKCSRHGDIARLYETPGAILHFRASPDGIAHDGPQVMLARRAHPENCTGSSITASW